MSAAEAIYPRLPIALQDAACGLYGRRAARTRLGRRFRERLAWLVDSEWTAAAGIAAYQDERVARLVARAYADVPYYRRALDAAGVAAADVRGRDDLRLLPVLTKEDVRAAGDDLRARGAPRRALLDRHTSGTTGTALHFLTSRDAVAFQWAVWWRHRGRFGLHPGDWHVNFTGKPVVPAAQSRPPWWRWSRPLRQALLPMQQLTPAKIADVVSFLDSHDFAFYSGYPSIVHAFALSALDAGLEPRRRPRAVVTGAEAMLESQRADIASLLPETVLTDHYGITEGVANASRCEQGRYHEDWEFCALECVDPEPQEDGSVRGRIVATGFACPEYPLIRYDTGDVGRWAPAGERCACGRESAVLLAVEGRTEDYVVTPEGRRIMRFDYVFKDSLEVREAQVVQERLGELTLRIVRRPDYGADDEERLRREVAHWISPRLDVRFEYPAEIEREPGGKFRAVRSLLAPEERAAAS